MIKEFKINFSEGSDVFCKLKLEFPFTSQEIIEALDNEKDWIQDKSTAHRTRLYHPTNPKLKEIIKYFSSDELHTKLCKQAYNYFPEIKTRWGLDIERLKNISSVHGEFNKDLPGWRQAIHMDIKHYICTGFVYLIEDDDEQLSSFFYSDINGNDPIRAETNFGSGWFHVNDLKSWHGGHNITKNKTRYTILFPLLIKSLKRHF